MVVTGATVRNRNQDVFQPHIGRCVGSTSRNTLIGFVSRCSVFHLTTERERGPGMRQCTEEMRRRTEINVRRTSLYFNGALAGHIHIREITSSIMSTGTVQ